MTTQGRTSRFWTRIPVSIRAIVAGLLIGLVAANVWPPLLLTLGAPLAAVAEAAFLALYVWWAAGGGIPRGTQTARATAFRRGALSPARWAWGLVGAVFFAATIHAAIVLLFRFVPYPTLAFRHGYDFSFIPSQWRWFAVVASATSAGICEEIGFRGYMQRPIEVRHGAPIAILTSSFLFMAVHLSKDWASLGMIPIVFGAGLLLGLLAWSSESLIPPMIGHVAMDIGLFAYWWTGIAGDFRGRPISETGIDQSFLIACVVFGLSLSTTLLAISKLRRTVDRETSDSKRH
jgi:membrane protease YdiL (CAAX protease family)